MLPKIVFLKAPRPATETIRLVHDGVAYDVEAEPLMLKAQGIPAGARWITVHPNGRDQKGVPVLIQETQHGSGTFHVIGGAGGKLNYLKLRGVKSAGDYAQDVRERQTEKRKAKAEQTARDKAAGTHESKQKQRAVVKDAQRRAEREFVEHVAAKLGWAPDDMAPPPAEKLQGLSEKAQAKALETHHKALVQRATEAAGLAKARLVIEQDKRLADHLNEPMVDDPAREGLGYATDYTGRTADQAESIRQEAAALDDARTPPDKKEAAAKAKDTAGKIRDELKRADVPLADVKAKMVEANDAVDILKAAAKLKAVRKEAAKANKDIDAGRERKAFVLEVSDADLDQQVRDQLEQDLRTLKTRAFLEEVGKAGNEDALGRHLGAGAYNALNGVAITLGGQPVIDRDAVDVLGTAGAAQVLARALKQSMSPEDFAQATDALEAFHSDHYLQRSEEALRESAELHEQIKEMKLPDAEDGRDLQAAHELIERKREAIGKLRQHLGQALGEMEAHAALIVAMKGNTDAPVQVPLGQLKTEDAIRRLRAIGLNAGDYSLQFAGPEAIATVDPKGQDRLAAKPDPEHAKAVRDSLDIQQGRQDDPDFWPQGVARRPDLALKQNLPAGTARDFARPFEPGPNMGQSIRDYIGSRMADGHGIGDIVRDLQSEELAGQAGERRADYFQALNEVVPLTDADGKPIEHEARRADFERHADMHMAREYGGRFSPLHAQPLAVDDISAEAMHRALSAEPAGALAFKAVGELGPKDQGALRDYFDRHIGGQDEQTATLKRQLDEHTAEGQEPERETEDMFGRGTNPAWVAWKQRREELQEKLRTSGLPWNRYVSVMGGPEHAYAAVQDHARGRVVQSFTEAHNKLRPDAPLKLGRTTVRNHIAHLDAVDPAAREKRLAEQREMIDGLRNRIAGRYSAGSVRDRMEASREAQQALEQSQLGFFATAPENKAQAPLGKDERHTVGAAAEQQLARLAEHVGTNFQPGQPVKLSPPTMTGKFVAQQRSIKLIERNKRLALGLGVGSGKAQPLDARILTPRGWRRMGDMQIGDEVFAGDGSVTHVVGVYPQGQKEIVRVRMADGGVTECCHEHLWLTTTEVERKRIARGKASSGSVKSMAQIRDSLIARGSIRNHHIPVASPLALPTRTLPIPPYMLGLLLGDGKLSGNSVSFCKQDSELLEYLTSNLPAGVTIKADGSASYRLSVRRGGNDCRNPLLDSLRGLGLSGTCSHERFVPPAYLLSSRDQRLDLLRGLMDTDGCPESGGSHVTFCTTAPQLADDVEFLCRSLGGLSRRSTKIPQFTHRGEKKQGRMAFVITLTMPASVNPFRLSRKASKVLPKTKYQPRSRVIVGVDVVGAKQAQCIAIAHPSRLYITDDFIVTHNTAIGLNSFAHLHSQGKVKRGIYAVPSIVQGQFGNEALNMLEPGKFKWHAQPGASREERLAAYKDPGTHFSVVTHQGFRDDMLHLGAQQAGIEPAEMSRRVSEMSPAERKTWARGVMDAHGMDHDFMMVDEGHGLLDRAGKEDSGLSNVLGAVSANMTHYVSASADPVKNDASEAFSLLQKIAPDRYTDRAAFMRRYGVDTVASKDQLRREMAPYLYSDRIDPGVRVHKREVPVELSGEQKADMAKVDEAAAKLRLSRLAGSADVDAAKLMSPDSFEGVPEEQHAEVAKRLAQSVGILHETAAHRILSAHPKNNKTEKLVELARERKGKPGVVFARSRDAVAQIAQRLRDEGHRVVTITGSDSAKEKSAKRLKFRPEQGEPEADILVASDAGATGLNAQRGAWLMQYDTPLTAMTHAQRNGRIHRLGQKNPDIETIDLVANHPKEHEARRRLTTKYRLRDALTSPLEHTDDSGFAGYLRQRQQQDQGQGGLF